ncbi:MAG TPA: ABC transporter substrate-binding protein [Dehalococcoidales bacterium]|nr:ABC transporter substrate-binding protein [Dehalococcoidales bacterium]
MKNGKTIRKKFPARSALIALVITLAAILVVGCGSPSPAGVTQTTPTQPASTPAQPSITPTAQPLTKLIVADARSTHHLNLYVALEKGILSKYGLDVEIKTVDELTAARDAVVTGAADVYWSCPTAAISAIAGGAPIKVIAQVKEPCTSVLLVPKDSPIKTLADLKDKNIAGISPSCEAVISISVAAKKAGGEFTLSRLAGGPAITALDAKQVDAAILEEPHASIAELKGYVVLFREVSQGIPCRTINARAGYLSSQPDALKRLVKAVDEANSLILANPLAQDIVAIAAKYTGAPEGAILNGNKRLGFTIYINEPGYAALIDTLLELKTIKENPGTKIYADEFKGITWGLAQRPVKISTDANGNATVTSLR